MAIKTIAAFLDGSEASEARLGHAIAIAEATGAHLVAVALARQIDIGVYAVPGAEMAVDLTQIDESRARAKALAEAAEKRIEAAGISGETRWTSAISAGIEETAARAARHADLSICGPAGGDGPEEETAEAALEGALFYGGRPVLIMPRAWKGGSFAKRVMVCWDGSRVAARAIGDALPLMATAEKVSVTIVDPTPGEGGFGEEPGADIAAMIARHGAKVTVDRLPSAGASTAERLGQAAADGGFDLMVMGGYGHSRLREAIFSGVSRQLFEQPPVPVFTAH
jgi:nucleotide-binding universal stress UspA family protein